MAEDLVVSGIRIETDQLLSGQRRIEQSISQIEQKASKLDAAFKKSASASASLGASTDRTRTMLEGYRSKVAELQGRLDKLSSSQQRAASTSASASRSFKLQEGAAASLGRRIAGLAAAYISVFGAIRLARGFVSVNRELQDLQANLQTVTGSAGSAAKAFRDITQFAKETPFEIKGLTEAFVRLQAFGAGPTIEQFRGLGNVSAAFSRDITTLSDAIVSTVNSSIEPIRQFGVQASVAGDKLTVSFNGVTATIPRTTKALAEFLAEAGNTGQFAGAMERRMNTLGGSISNLSDVVTILAADVGKQGLNAEIISLVKELTSAIQSSDEFARSIGQGAAGAVRLLREAMQIALPVMNTFSNLLAAIGNQSNRIAVPEIAAIQGIDNLDALETRRKQLDAQLQHERRVLDEMNAKTAGGLTGLGRRLLLQGDHEELAAQTAEVEGLIAALNAADQKKRELAEIAATPPTEVGSLLGLGGGKAKKAKEEISDVQRALDALAEDLRGIAALKDALEGTGIAFDANAEAAKAYENALQAVAGQEEASAELVAELAGNYVGLERAVRRAAAAEEQRANMRSVRRENVEKHEEALRGFKQREHEISDQKMLAELERQKQLAEDIATSFSDAFASIITGTETVADAFRKMAEDIISQLIRIAIQQQFINPLIASLFPTLGEQFSTGIDLGPTGTIQGLARGGPMRAGQTALVGEEGPELFRPRGSGEIVPHRQSMAILRGQEPSAEQMLRPVDRLREIERFRDTERSREIERSERLETIRERAVLFPDLPHFAAGGPIKAGQTSVVGEKGPELFTPSSAGRITPNDQLGGGGSQVIVHAPVVLQSQNIDNRSAGQLYEQSAHKIASEVVRVIERNASMRRRISR